MQTRSFKDSLDEALVKFQTRTSVRRSVVIDRSGGIFTERLRETQFVRILSLSPSTIQVCSEARWTAVTDHLGSAWRNHRSAFDAVLDEFLDVLRWGETQANVLYREAERDIVRDVLRSMLEKGGHPAGLSMAAIASNLHNRVGVERVIAGRSDDGNRPAPVHTVAFPWALHRAQLSFRAYVYERFEGDDECYRCDTRTIADEPIVSIVSDECERDADADRHLALLVHNLSWFRRRDVFEVDPVIVDAPPLLLQSPVNCPPVADAATADSTIPPSAVPQRRGLARLLNVIGL